MMESFDNIAENVLAEGTLLLSLPIESISIFWWLKRGG
jgi:hypothetical protein